MIDGGGEEKKKKLEGNKEGKARLFASLLNQLFLRRGKSEKKEKEEGKGRGAHHLSSFSPTGGKKRKKTFPGEGGEERNVTLVFSIF